MSDVGGLERIWLLSKAEVASGARVLSSRVLGRALVDDGSSLCAVLVEVERQHPAGGMMRQRRVVLATMGPRHRRQIELRPRELHLVAAWLGEGAEQIPAPGEDA